jgi:hypothetical protein
MTSLLVAVEAAEVAEVAVAGAEEDMEAAVECPLRPAVPRLWAEA